MRIAKNNTTGLYATENALSQYALTQANGQLIATAITMGLASFTGIFVGIMMHYLNKQNNKDHYHDRGNWIIEQDCISEREDIHAEEEFETQSGEEGEQSSDRVFEKVVYKEIVVKEGREWINQFVHL
jgi:cbb3-type cytochrome oxidase subunit 3